MSPSTNHPFLVITAAGDVTVVRFTRRTLLECEAIEAVGEQLLALTNAGTARLVLNFGGVESLTSGMLGWLFALHRRIEEAGGRLAFCNVDPFLLQIFRVCQVPEKIPLFTDEQEAVQNV